jgi:hypothetical protein
MTRFPDLARRSRGMVLAVERPLPGHSPRLQILHGTEHLFVDAILLKPCSLEQLAAALIRSNAGARPGCTARAPTEFSDRLSAL